MDDDQFGLPPETILRDYVILRMIGQGGFGVTYLAHDRVFDRNVAIKEFLPTDFARRFGNQRVGPRTVKQRAAFDYCLQEFLEEAKLLDRLDHPNVVRVRSFFRENDTAYLVMQYVPGPTLEAWLADHRTVSRDELLALLRGLIAGLQHIHAMGALHRDIKPANIILREGSVEQPVLIDFGAAKSAIAERTRTLAAIVSAGYTPLEQYSGTRRLSAGSDVYSLCATAYRCILGTEPPSASDRALSESIESLATVAANRYPTAVLRALDDGLRMRLEQRPADLTALRDAVGELPGERPSVGISAAPPNHGSSAPTLSRGPSALPPNHGRPAGVPAPAPEVNRAALRDRNQQTMLVEYAPSVAASEPAAPVFAGERSRRPSAPPSEPAQTQPSYPKPILIGLLALLVGGIWCLSSSLAKEGALVALLWFPGGAYVGAFVSQRIALRRPSTLRWCTLSYLFSYVIISLFATLLFVATILPSALLVPILASQDIESPLEIIALPVGGFMFLASAAPVAFGIFAAGLGVLLFAARRFGHLADQQSHPIRHRSTLLPGAVFAVMLVTMGVLGYSSLADDMKRLTKDQLIRVGYIKNEEATTIATAIRSIEARLNKEETGQWSLAVYRALTDTPTADSFTVAQDGTGDFESVVDANDHLRRLSLLSSKVLASDAKPAIKLTLRPGSYTGQIDGQPGMQIVGVGPIEKIVLTPAEDAYSATIEVVDNMLVQGLTIRGSTNGEQPAIVIRTSVEARIEGNRIDARNRLADGSSAAAAEDLTRCAIVVYNGVDANSAFVPAKSRVAIRSNSISGSCGINTRAGASVLVEGNTFTDIARDAMTFGETSTAMVGRNVYARVGENLIYGFGQAKVEIVGASLRHTNTGFAMLAVAEQAAIELRDVNLSARNTHCLWAGGGGTPQFLLEGARSIDCGDERYPPFYLGKGASGTIRNSSFKLSARGSNPAGYAYAEDGAVLSMINNNVLN